MKMAKADLQESLKIPEGVQVKEEEGVFTVQGPKGTVARKLYHPRIAYEVAGGEVLVRCEKATKREKKLLYTYKAHLRNMFKGVTRGFTYKLKICASHFPMNVSVNGNKLEVKNFIGEKQPRVLELPSDVQVKVEGDFITVEGVDKERVGQTAASIETLTKRRGFDKRIYQDGIYLVQKDDKVIA